MAELRALVASLGLEDVRTLVQSGNVVFRGTAVAAHDVAERIERRIAEVFGLDVAVLVRTPVELAEIAASNPFLPGETELSKLHVAFLDRVPGADAVARLDARRSPPDAFSVRGREIFLHYPSGAGRSKLTLDYFERRLAVRGTARNWNTLTKLLAMTGDG
jgi:uncharacterized protein (DUF1697 family)